MLALLPSILPVLLMYFVQVHHDINVRDKQHLDAFSLISLITTAYLMLVIIGENILTLSLSGRILTFAVLLMLLISPLTVVSRAHLDESSKILSTGASSQESERKPLIEDDRFCREEANTWTEHPSTADYNEEIQVPREHGANLNILQAMQTCNFWILFIAISCGMGSGLATINNMSQIGSSLGYSRIATNTLVSLWSIWNFVGRFGSGYLSDYLLRRRGWARTLFIVLTLGIMSAGHLLISTGLPGSLHMGSVLVGVCYGSQWALMPSITSELFGLTHFGTIFNSIAIASPIGSYIFSVRVVGYIYDMQAQGSGTCTGRNCFMLPFLIMASATLIGSAVSFALFLRTRRFYKQVIYTRLQTSDTH